MATFTRANGIMGCPMERADSINTTKVIKEIGTKDISIMDSEKVWTDSIKIVTIVILKY